MFGCLAAVLLAGPVRTDADGVPLPAEAVCRIGSARWRAAGDLHTLSATPDWRTLIGQDGRYLLGWDATTGRPTFRTLLPDVFAPTITLEIDPPAVRVEWTDHTVDDAPFSVVWYDPATGRQLGSPRVLLKRTRGETFLSPSGRVLYEKFTDVNRRYGLDEADSVLTARPVSGPGREVELVRQKKEFRAAADPHDRFVLTHTDSTGDPIRVVDATSGKLLRELPTGDRWMYTLAVDPTGATAVARVSCGSVSGYVRWDVMTGRATPLTAADSENRKSDYESTRFSPCGRFLFARETFTAPGESGSYEMGVLRAANNGRMLLSPLLTSPLTVSADGQTVYSTRFGDQILRTPLFPRAATVPDDPPELSLNGGSSHRLMIGERHELRSRSLSIDPRTGRRLAIGPWLGSSADDWETWHEWGGETSGRQRIEIRLQKTAGMVGIRLRDLLDGSLLPLASVQFGMPTTIRFIAGGRQVIYAATNSFRVWDAATGRLVRQGTLTDFDASHSLAVSVDGRRVAALFQLPQHKGKFAVRVWDTSTGGGPTTHPLPDWGSTPGLQFSIDGRFLTVASGSMEGEKRGVRVLDLARQKPPFDVIVKYPSFQFHNLTPDNRCMICSAHVPPALQLIEMATGVVRHQFSGHFGEITSAFSTPDGRYIAAASPDAPIFVWDVRGELSKPTAVSAAELDRAVRELASGDAKLAWNAVRVLAQFPTEALPRLKAALPAVPQLPAGAVVGWIRQLDAPRFADRQAAVRELANLGRAAETELLTAGKDTSSAEVRRRAGELLAKIADGKPTADELKAIRAVETVEWMGTPDARKLLIEWAAGGKHARLTVEATDALTRVDGKK